MRTTRRVVGLLALPTIGLAVAFALAPDRRALEVHAWLLILLILSLTAFMGVVRTAFPTGSSPFAASLRRPSTHVDRPGSLLRLERELSMAGSSAFDVHYRLRPTLVEMAAELLKARRGIDLDREPDASHAVLGNDAWALVRPDREPPAERLGAGITAPELERVVTALEEI